MSRGLIIGSAKGSCSLRDRNCRLKVRFAWNWPHQFSKRSLTVSLGLYDDIEFARLCCGIGPSRNCELPLFRFTLGVSLLSGAILDLNEEPIPKTPVLNVVSLFESLSAWYPRPAFSLTLLGDGPTDMLSIS